LTTVVSTRIMSGVVGVPQVIFPLFPPGVAIVTLQVARRVRTGAAPQVLAAIRNVVVHLLDGVKAATRYFAARPCAALSLLFT
jgi:hypothetical protein